MITCGSCGTENPAAHSFCSNCGNALARTCGNCDTPNDPGNKFCFSCGSSLGEGQVVASSPPLPSADSGERRLVSVVFADLVGYTTLSEGRDPEDIRAMLTDYYDRCRQIIARYGGVTDKFIGDAVMGVFGADTAHEDDAERATRTALELVDMVRGLGGDFGMEGLDARAGVMSGEASVGSGGNALGLVVGDLVNTASRLQSIAPPGGVFVGESTKDLVGPAIEFVPMGRQDVKGKAIPVEAFQAKRVVALSHARQRGDLAEGPFVGREDELRLLKDQLHATGREQRARMVSVIGEGGIGKTRLSQELLRYIDGIAEVIYYHNGRSPSYGDGVTFWALGEMIRQRAGILEGEDAAKSRLKLRTTVAEYAPDEDDQKWIEPRLAALIGLTEMPRGDRSELYAALRTFFQRIAERGTVLMVFEDLHWADDGLLDFIEELVERTTQNPILVLALARPEILDRHPDWGTNRRRSLSMHLSRLDDSAMMELVAGLAPGIPEDVVARIAQRTAGVPLHAVEFVRMLINSSQLVPAEQGYQLVGDIGDLAIPETVSAIISARLDRLDPAAASLIQDASVLGLSFTPTGIAHLQGKTLEDVEPILRSLVRNDVLELDENPRSPERGQYRFVQSLIREVAYRRLPKSDRVSRHLEVARHFEDMKDPELAGVVAGHYAFAAAADPGNAELVAHARDALVASAERAAELHSDTQAASLYGKAIDLAGDASVVADLKIQLARCLDASGREDLAIEAAHEALEFYRDKTDELGVARAATVGAHTLSSNFDASGAVDLILPVYESSALGQGEDWARLAMETSRALALANDNSKAIEVADRAIPVLEELGLVEELLETLNNKSLALVNSGRWMEGIALLRGIGELAAEHGLLNSEIRAINNLEASLEIDNRTGARFDQLERLIAKSGNLSWQIRLYFFGSYDSFTRGDIGEALGRVEAAEELDLSDFWAEGFEKLRLAYQQVRDGADAGILTRILELTEPARSDDVGVQAYNVEARAEWYLIHGDFSEAVKLAVDGPLDPRGFPGLLQTGLEAAVLAGDVDSAHVIAERLEAITLRGRALDGLKSLATTVTAGLQGDVEEALVARSRMEELWEGTMTPLGRVRADAMAAQLFPSDHPVAVEAARSAERFFTEHGFRAFLDIYQGTFERFRSEDEGLAAS